MILRIVYFTEENLKGSLARIVSIKEPDSTDSRLTDLSYSPYGVKYFYGDLENCEICYVNIAKYEFKNNQDDWVISELKPHIDQYLRNRKLNKILECS